MRCGRWLVHQRSFLLTPASHPAPDPSVAAQSGLGGHVFSVPCSPFQVPGSMLHGPTVTWSNVAVASEPSAWLVPARPTYAVLGSEMVSLPTSVQLDPSVDS